MESKKEIQELKNAFAKAVEFLSSEYKGSSLTDIFVLVDKDSGELSIYDDEENCVLQEIISTWEEKSNSEEYSDDENMSAYSKSLRRAVEQMDKDEAFASLDVFKPFSINLADENFAVLEELLLIEDDSLIRIENDFMEKMDKEFDEFLDRLLKD